jgi:hypothetical protein
VESAVCPPNNFALGGVCRPSSGPCDAVEICDGLQAQCPSNQYVAAGHKCSWIDACACNGSGACVATLSATAFGYDATANPTVKVMLAAGAMCPVQ